MKSQRNSSIFLLLCPTFSFFKPQRNLTKQKPFSWDAFLQQTGIFQEDLVSFLVVRCDWKSTSVFCGCCLGLQVKPFHHWQSRTGATLRSWLLLFWTSTIFSIAFFPSGLKKCLLYLSLLLFLVVFFYPYWRCLTLFLETSLFTLCKAVDMRSLCVAFAILDFFFLNFAVYFSFFLSNDTILVFTSWKGLQWILKCEKLIKSCLVQMHYMSTLRAIAFHFSGLLVVWSVTEKYRFVFLTKENFYCNWNGGPH